MGSKGRSIHASLRTAISIILECNRMTEIGVSFDYGVHVKYNKLLFHVVQKVHLMLVEKYCLSLVFVSCCFQNC